MEAPGAPATAHSPGNADPARPTSRSSPSSAGEWPDGPVIGVRTEGLDGKEALLGSFPDVFFTIPHFDGYPAVLVRLDAIDLEQLREVVTDAWLLKAPKRVAKEWLAEHDAE